MKREQLNLKIPVLWTWDMWFRAGYLQVALGSNWLLRQPAEERNRRVPCRLTPVTVRILRVVLLGTAALNGWYIPSKAKYLLETDSDQVP